MGQMRNAFRAYAYDHSSPAEVLRRMGVTSRARRWRPRCA